MKRMGIGVNIMHRMMERKLNFSGRICRMPDDRLIKQVVFGILDGKNKRGRSKRRWIDELVDWCNKDIGTLYKLASGQNEMDTFRKICHGHQLALSPWRKRERESHPI